MIRQRVALVGFVLTVVLGWSVSAIRLRASQDELLRMEKALSPSEVERVLARVREAMDGKYVRLSLDGSHGPEILMSGDGLPKVVRKVGGWDVRSRAASEVDGDRTETGAQDTHIEVVTVTEYTRLPAQSCSGKDLRAELVIEYTQHSGGSKWTVSTKTKTSHEVGKPIFDILRGATPVASGPVRKIGGQRVRALVAPWQPPVDVQPELSGAADMVQSLWIDVDSMLPISWSVSPSAPTAGSEVGSAAYEISFTYDPSIRIELPQIDVPKCVPTV